MRKWLIEILGGVVFEDFASSIRKIESLTRKNLELQQSLIKALRNDTPRDPVTGKFVKK